MAMSPRTLALFCRDFFYSGMNHLTLCTLFVLIALTVSHLPADAVEQEKHPDAVDWTDIAYKKAKIMSGHAEPKETLDLINQLTRLGHLKMARELLDQGPPLPSHYHTARLDAELRIVIAEYFNASGKNATEKSRKAAVKEKLRRLTDEKQVKAADLARYVQTAEEFAFANVVISFCKKLITLDPANRNQWLFTAGQWSLSAKRFQEAARYFQQSYAEASNPKERLKCLVARLEALHAGGAHAKLTAEIESAIAAEQDREILVTLAQFSLQIERPDLTWRLYGRLFAIDPEHGDRWQAEIVRWATAAEQPLAAAVFLDSLPADNYPDRIKDLLLRNRFTLLKQGNRPREALALAQKLISRTPEDTELLEQTIQLALAAGDISLADSYSERLLQLKPQNRAALQRQANISLARKEPEKVIQSIRELFRNNPDDRKIERQLARLEELDGNPEAAYHHWRHLSQVENRLEDHEQVYRLSRLLKNQFTALEALENISDQRGLNPDELKAQMLLNEKFGEPETAVAVAAVYLKKYPHNQKIWLELAHLQMRSGDYRQAFETWSEIALRFGRDAEETLCRSECQWRTGRKRQALEVIDSFDGRLLSPRSTYQAELLVELSWRYRRPQLALSILDNLLRNYKQELFYIIERIIYLQQESGDAKEAFRIAMTSADQTEDQRFLVLALKLAAAYLNDKQVDSLLQKMNSANGIFDAEPFYWLIRAERKYARGDFQQAEELYLRVLKLAPDSLTAMEGELWSRLSMGDRDKLALLLDAWKPQALQNHELWLVYATSCQALGRYWDAAYWYERLIADGSRKYAIILGYADALDALGIADRAYRLRIWTLERLRDEAAHFIERPGKLTDDVKSYVTLMQRYGAVQQGDYWLQLLTKTQSDKAVRPWLVEQNISWYLNSKRFDDAKIWLAKARREHVATPVWQKSVLALKENNTKELAAILQDDARLDFENRLAILEKLHRRKEALQLAETGIGPQNGQARSSAARMQATTLRQDFPAYWGIGYETTFSDQLASWEAHLDSHYSLLNRPIGYDLTYRFKDYSSTIYHLNGHDWANDFSLAMILGDGRHGGSAAVGFNQHAADNSAYGRLEYHYELNQGIMTRLELGVHSIPDVDSILQIATLQNRMDATLSGALVEQYYYYLDLWGREYVTRDDDDVAKGFGATTEIGFKQNWGRFEWLTGVQGNYERNSDRKLPEYLGAMAPEGSSVDDVVSREATSLLVGGRIGRGTIGEKYPSTGSLRYFASAWLGYTWPQDKPTVNLSACVGSRVLGHDELGLQVRYNQSGGVVGRNDDSGVAIQYRYHF